MTQHEYRHDGLTFQALKFGTDRKGTLILLHGFPSSADAWTETAHILADAGYEVLVPKQRGYTDTSSPVQRKSYRLSRLVDDAAALIGSVGQDRVHLVGHDMGGMVAWGFANTYPDKLKSLTVVSAPHPRAMLRAYLTSRQFFRSWYMLFFQLPYLPERVLRAKNGQRLYKALKKSGLGDRFAQGYTEQMQNPLRLRSALNWYRALPSTVARIRKIGAIQTPTVFIYGEKDSYLTEHSARLTAKWCDGSFENITMNAGHWIPEESPAELAGHILKHIDRNDIR